MLLYMHKSRKTRKGKRTTQADSGHSKRETKKCISQGFIWDLGDTSARLWVLRYPHKRNTTTKNS